MDTHLLEWAARSLVRLAQQWQPDEVDAVACHPAQIMWCCRLSSVPLASQPGVVLTICTLCTGSPRSWQLEFSTAIEQARLFVTGSTCCTGRQLFIMVLVETFWLTRYSPLLDDGLPEESAIQETEQKF